MRAAKTGLALAALALMGFKAPRTEWAWTCKLTSQEVCIASGCERLKAPAWWVMLYPAGGLYTRCPSAYLTYEGCETYKATGRTSGEFQQFEIPDASTSARLGPDLAFTEFVSRPGGTLSAVGACEEAPPPVVRTDR